MSTDDKVFTGSIPQIYERYLVPLIFKPYASELAERVSRLKPDGVLEIAAGTGVLTRAMSAVLPDSARITATDLNGPMLDVAAGTLADARNIEWKVADALNLPFGEAAFDAVVCQFGVMFFPDKVQGFREARRVLRPDGTFLFNVWDKISENHFIRTVSSALAARYPQDPPKFMERTPHGYHDPEKIRQDLSQAGFGNVTIETVARVSRAPSAEVAAVAYCQGNPWRNEIEARDPTGLAEATRLSARALERDFGKGPIEGKIQALVITARN